VVDGEMTISAEGMMANFSCVEGYELVGSPVRFCFTDGTGWNGTQPRCGMQNAKLIGHYAKREVDRPFGLSSMLY